MTKILIVSDSHGLTKELEELKKRYRNTVDLMIHCGDSELEAANPAIQDFITVRGNCDFEKQFPEEINENIGGVNIFVTHGHLFSVKSSLTSLSYRAEELQASIVCFGHSHMLGAEMIQNTLCLNPGSIHLPRGRKEKTYLILKIEQKSMNLHVFDYTKGEIEELKQNFTFA